MSAPRPLDVRLWEKVDKSGECWLWTGYIVNGYGRLSVTQPRPAKIYAHRLSYELEHGPIPNGLQIDHLCRVRTCVRPSHLEAVTPAINIRRAFSSVSTINRFKTHCIAGHEFTPENTYLSPTGRRCRECKRELDRARSNRPKPAPITSGTFEQYTHGIRSTYVARKCRCPECVAAASEYRRAWRQRRKAS